MRRGQKRILLLGTAGTVLLALTSCLRAVDRPTGEGGAVTAQETRTSRTSVLGPQPAGPSYATGELIVKLAPEAGAVLDEALEANRPLTSIGLAWLDALDQAYGVSAIEPLFPHQVDPETIREKYPERAKRAPSTARAPTLKHIYTFRLRPDADVLQAAQDYASQPAVEYAQPNYRVTTQDVQ